MRICLVFNHAVTDINFLNFKPLYLAEAVYVENSIPVFEDPDGPSVHLSRVLCQIAVSSEKQFSICFFI